MNNEHGAVDGIKTGRENRSRVKSPYFEWTPNFG
jgi:hypothetical protein